MYINKIEMWNNIIFNFIPYNCQIIKNYEVLYLLIMNNIIDFINQTVTILIKIKI